MESYSVPLNCSVCASAFFRKHLTDYELEHKKITVFYLIEHRLQPKRHFRQCVLEFSLGAGAPALANQHTHTLKAAARGTSYQETIQWRRRRRCTLPSQPTWSSLTRLTSTVPSPRHCKCVVWPLSLSLSVCVSVCVSLCLSLSPARPLTPNTTTPHPSIQQVHASNVKVKCLSLHPNPTGLRPW